MAEKSKSTRKPRPSAKAVETLAQAMHEAYAVRARQVMAETNPARYPSHPSLNVWESLSDEEKAYWKGAAKRAM